MKIFTFPTIMAAVFAIAACASFGATEAQPAGDATRSTAPSIVKPSQTRPSVVYVADFRLDPSSLVASEKPVESGLLGRQRPLAGRAAPLSKPKTPEEQRQQIVHDLSDSIIEQLQRDGIEAKALSGLSADYSPDQANGKLRFVPTNYVLPTEGWLLTGWLEQIQEGNAAVEATVGFGKGAGKATADVAICDLAGDPAQAFLVMGSGSRAKKMPGGLVMLNPYVMAAKFVLDKRQGVEKEVKSLGREIAKQLADYIQHPPST